jgi:hypothetical protein
MTLLECPHFPFEIWLGFFLSLFHFISFLLLFLLGSIGAKIWIQLKSYCGIRDRNEEMVEIKYDTCLV